MRCEPLLGHKRKADHLGRPYWEGWCKNFPCLE